MIVLASAVWLLSWVFVTCLNWAAARQVWSKCLNICNSNQSTNFLLIQVFRVRGEFLRAILRQDVGWYDTNTATDFASKMTE